MWSRPPTLDGRTKKPAQGGLPQFAWYCYFSLSLRLTLQFQALRPSEILRYDLQHLLG